MRAVVWLGLASLCAMSAYAQRGGGGHSPGGGAGGAHGGPPAAAPVPRGPGGGYRGAFPNFPYFPLYPDVWDYGYAPGYDYGYAPPPPQNVTIVQPPPVIVPERIPHAEIREYAPAPAAAPSVPAAEAPSFAIALRDGSVHSAIAVTVQDDTVHYVDPDGRHERVPLESVDRDTTTRLNRERKLELHLPPPANR